jgi:flagella basal body P-ring formation protein FlgA
MELSQFPVPAGEIVFSRTALNEPASNALAIWNGVVVYDGGRFPIWVRAQISIHQKRVVAVLPLRPGHPIPASDVELQEVDEFPHSAPPLASLDRVIGRLPRRMIAAGAPVMANSIDEPNDVDPGQTVVVEVHSGAAVVTIEAKAESAGRRGDMLSFRNPVSGKVFRARLEDKGRALIDCQPLEIAQ